MKTSILLSCLVTILFIFSPVKSQSDSVSVAVDTLPEAMPLIETGDYDLTNILLLGSDTTNPENSGRTDVLMVVSINQTENTVALLSIPRDLYVYIPDWEMNRINTVYGHGETVEEGTGAQLLMETIEYNLGLVIDRYARVDFIGFKQIVDAVGGIEVPVDCAIQDWRLIEPDLDPTVEDNWAMFTLPIGMQVMDGDLALWYVRSRRTSSDIDRGQRHQDVMRALWQHVRTLGLVSQVSEVWPQITSIVETDITLPEILGLAPLALTLEPSSVASFTFHINQDILDRLSDEGARVLVPQREPVQELIRKFLLPPTGNQLASERVRIKITNATGDEDLDEVIANRVISNGFVPIMSGEMATIRQVTQIVDYTGRTKGGRLGELQKLFRVGDDSVIREPDANRVADYEVILGQFHYACTRSVLPPT